MVTTQTVSPLPHLFLTFSSPLRQVPPLIPLNIQFLTAFYKVTPLLCSILPHKHKVSLHDLLVTATISMPAILKKINLQRHQFQYPTATFVHTFTTIITTTVTETITTITNTPTAADSGTESL